MLIYLNMSGLRTAALTQVKVQCRRSSSLALATAGGLAFQSLQEGNMSSMRKVILTVIPLLAIAACTTSLNDQDRALLTSANQNADLAKQQSAQALSAAQTAQASAAQAAADAKAAGEKSDRMFQRSLRK